MANQTTAEFDLDSLLAAMRPPDFPDETFVSSNRALYKLTLWKKNFTVSVLAGLSTVPDFCANSLRLDWLQRLTLSHSEGKRKPPSAELSRALNVGLDQANVRRLEDPNEDLFCDLVVTRRGNFRILPGQWEAAASCTQTLLDAFEGLASVSLHKDALESAYSLLRLSDQIAERASVNRDTPSANNPNGPMTIPSDSALRQLGRRVRFTNPDLTRLKISKDALAPFFLAPEQNRNIGDRPPGETPLEFYPLLDTAIGVVVASPTTISLAVRALLIVAAQRTGVDEMLLRGMMVEQQAYSEASVFWPMPSLRLPPPDRLLLRSAACEYEPGRFLQVIQAPIRFDGFPQIGFGSVRQPGAETNESIVNHISSFWHSLEKQDCRRSTTVLLLSGWGPPFNVALQIDHGNAPKHWRFLGLSFTDAAVLGACENGSYRDLSRILEQVARLEDDGFSFQNLSGTLNLFGFWRLTDGNLIPENAGDILPPCHVSLPTDALLAPRLEAAKKRDLHALPLPDGTVTIVQRMEWSDRSDLQPVYASVKHLSEKRLLGVVVRDHRIWWVDSMAKGGETGEWRYRIWHAVLQWLEAIGTSICRTFPKAFPEGVASVLISTPSDAAFDVVDASKPKKRDLAETIVEHVGDGDSPHGLRVLPEWVRHLGFAENVAEVELIAAVLCQLAMKPTPALDELRAVVLDCIGSTEWRWLHLREVLNPLDRMASSGLAERFRRIPLSAFSLVKCGSVWGFRERAAGLQVRGETDCKHFLTRYRDHILDELISDVRTFDREKLVIAAINSYQAARLEQSQWRRTIRALKAIHGERAYSNALDQQNAINAVQRAAKSICEIAACEAPQFGGNEPSRSDLDEMFARSLLLLANGHLFAAIRSGLIKPELRISPAGDLLSDRSIFKTIMTPVAEWANTRALNEADAFYNHTPTLQSTQTSTQRPQLDEHLLKTVEAEYRTSADALFALPFILMQIAEQKTKNVFVMKLSEFAHLVEIVGDFKSNDTRHLFDRLILPRRTSWRDLPPGLTKADIDLGRFDRRTSLINRPLLALSSEADPIVLLAPILVSDAIAYSISGLMDGSLNDHFWMSREAVKLAGRRGNLIGEEFENSVAARLNEIGLEAWPRISLSWAINEKVDERLGDIDILAVSPDRKRVWVIEAKTLRVCRSESEFASRLSEYRGRLNTDSKGRQKPDKMLRHIRRVQYLRQRSAKLRGRLKLDMPPEVKGLLIVDAPQPMNFHMLEALEDGDSAFLDTLGDFAF